MGYIARYFFVFGLCIIIAAASCTNNSPVAGAQKQLVGKWKIVKITTEENYNEASGGADENDVVVTFNADGTGSSSSTSGGSAFKWVLSNNDLNITDSATAQVTALKLTKSSPSSFTVKDSSTHPAQYEIFKKQNDK